MGPTRLDEYELRWFRSLHREALEHRTLLFVQERSKALVTEVPNVWVTTSLARHSIPSCQPCSAGQQPPAALAAQHDDPPVVLQLQLPRRPQEPLAQLVHFVGGDDADHPQLASAELHHAGDAIFLRAVDRRPLRPGVGEVMALTV